VLFQPANPLLEFADDEPVSDHSGMILDHRPAKADNLLASVLLHCQHVGRDVRPQGMEIGLGRHLPALGLHFRFQRLDFALDIADVSAQAAQMLDDDIFGLLGHEVPSSLKTEAPVSIDPAFIRDCADTINRAQSPNGRLTYSPRSLSDGQSSGRRPSGQWYFRSLSRIGASLMLATRRRIRPRSSNSHISLP